MARPPVFLRPKDVCERLGIVRSTLTKWRTTGSPIGDFPEPEMVTRRHVQWRLAVIDKFERDYRRALKSRAVQA